MIIQGKQFIVKPDIQSPTHSISNVISIQEALHNPPTIAFDILHQSMLSLPKSI